MSELADQLRGFDTCTLSDALDAMGLPSGVGGFNQYGPAKRIVGPATTVRLVADDGRPREQHLGTAAIEAAHPGSIIVVEHLEVCDAAGWGGLLSVAAQHAQVAGVVVDGTCRDVDDYFDLDFIVLARRSVPATARSRVIEGESGSSITIGGVVVNPDDWVVGDRSGVVVIPALAVDELINVATKIAQREQLMMADLRSGVKVTEVLGRQYETMLNEPHRGGETLSAS